MYRLDTYIMLKLNSNHSSSLKLESVSQQSTLEEGIFYHWYLELPMFGDNNFQSVLMLYLESLETIHPLIAYPWVDFSYCPTLGMLLP